MDLRELQPLPVKPRGAQFQILFVGRLAPQKGIDVLLRALAVTPHHWRLDIMGDGPEGDRLKTLAGHLGVGERVRWHGSCRFEDIARAYATADVVAAPSIIGPGGRTEGIPNVLMEALACERPVVASRVSGVPELVVDGVSGLLVPPGDVEALVAALRRIEDDPAQAAAMAQAGRRIIEQHYDLRNTAASQFNAFLQHRHRAEGAPATAPAAAINPRSSA
jgi:glycosyltransferase involved in cell wall biosynthesis